MALSKEKKIVSEIEKIGRVTNASVLKGTHKSWSQWIQILEKAGARQLERKDLVTFLVKKYKLNSWWVQIVVSGYEIHIGKRVDGWNAKGEYSITATKTFSRDAKTVWKWVTSAVGVAIWLNPLSPFHLQIGETFENENGIFGELRTYKKGERMRLTWQDTDWDKKTIVQINVVERPGQKSILVFQHEQLRQGRLRESIRQYWRTVLADLEDHFQK